MTGLTEPIRAATRFVRAFAGVPSLFVALGLHAAPYALESSVLPAGGGAMGSARFSVLGSAGQPVATAALSTGPRLASRAGFWNRLPRWLPALQAPVAMEAYLNTRSTVPGLRLFDLDAGAALVDFRISATNGSLTLAAGVPGGVEPAAVTGNGTKSVRIVATALALARSLAATNGLAYTPDSGYLGPDGIALRLEVDGLEPGGPLRAQAAVPVTVRFRPTVVGRWVFYNHSAWDGNNPEANPADDAAIATDKSALLPGLAAGFTNYTSYAKGLNGIMVDISGVPLNGVPTLADFDFRVGNDNAPPGWPDAPAPTTVALRRGAGTGGSDRVTLVWGTNAVRKAWLEVRVLAGARTGLEVDEVFYFGNAVGEVGNAAGTDAGVNEVDEVAVRQNQRGPFSPAAIDSVHDLDRDRLVNATDQLIARANATAGGDALQLITPAINAGPALAGRGGPETVEVRLVAWRDAAGWLRLEAEAAPAAGVDWVLEFRSGSSPQDSWTEVGPGVTSGDRMAWQFQPDEQRSSAFFRVARYPARAKER